MSQTFQGWGNTQQIFPEYCVPAGLFSNDEPCMVRPAIIDMNHNELKYYPFMISLNKCTRSCNVSSPKNCVPNETIHINVKTFYMARGKD